jgi:serine protease AprX
MKRTRSVRWHGVCAGLALGALLVPGQAQPAAQADVAHAQPALLHQATAHPTARVRVIVQAQGPTAGLERQVTRLGGYVTRDLALIHAFAATLPARAVPQIARARGVRWISPDAATTASYTCCSAATLQSVYPQAVAATQLWSAAGTPLQGQGIGVAVVDSGVNNNSDFSGASGGNRVVARAKFNSNTNSMVDGYGHGTHVAGIIGGNGYNSSGNYMGVAPQVNLINVKVSDDTGNALISDVVNGLQWVFNNAATYNIRVVNLSLNSTMAASYQVDPLDAAVETLWNAGIVVVVSAGNNGTTNSGVLYAPANDPFAITVGAVDDMGTASTSDDTRASFSAYGTEAISATSGLNTTITKPDLVAPGVNITSVLASSTSTLAQTHPANVVGSSYFTMSGTSMAAPVVAGVAALLLQSNPSLTPNQVKYRLTSTATPLASTTGTGAGEVKAYAAVTSTATATANSGIAPAASIQPGDPAALWGSASWGSASWGSTTWTAASWGSASWGSASWGSDYWGTTRKGKG